MSPIAGIVSKQEGLEGDLRFAHMRIRTYQEQVLAEMKLSDVIWLCCYSQSYHCSNYPSVCQ